MVGICYDIHSHLLPGMDDGCKSPEESIQVLRIAACQGVRAMFATPHYYPVESIGDFLQRRQQAAERLKAALAQQSEAVPAVCLGAEVAYRQGISADPDLRKLCLGGTDYLLLELPFHNWGNDVMRELRNISVSQGLIPVLAHLERYVGIATRQQLETILEMDVLVQVNGESFLGFSGRQAVKKLLRCGPIHLLGSDCHNLTTRKPNLGETTQYLQKHKMVGLLETANELAGQIFFQSQENELLRI